MKRSSFLKALFVAPAVPFVKGNKEDLNEKFNSPNNMGDLESDEKGQVNVKGKFHINGHDIIDIMRAVAKQEG